MGMAARTGENGRPRGGLLGVIHLIIFDRALRPHHLEDEYEEGRNEEDRKYGCRDHPAENTGADRVLAGGTGSRGDRQWHDAEGEGERGHDDRTEPDT
ncbi:hypothetical protein D3C80_701910 [compost metagenome]